MARFYVLWKMSSLQCALNLDFSKTMLGFHFYVWKETAWETRHGIWEGSLAFNTLWPRQNGPHFADDIFKWIFLNENVISLKFVPQGPIDNIPALVQIMAWRRPGDKPLSGSMMARLPKHICVTRPQWVNTLWPCDSIWWHISGSTLVQEMA